MAESDARVEKFINNLGFPARRGEKSEEHIGRVTRLFVQIADNLRPKMDQIISAARDEHDRDDLAVFGALDSVVRGIKQNLDTDKQIKGISTQEQADLLIDRIRAASVDNKPNEWKCAGLSFPDGNPFDSDRKLSPKTLAAKALCVSCEMRHECLDRALKGDEKFNVWGGLSPAERRRSRRRV